MGRPKKDIERKPGIPGRLWDILYMQYDYDEVGKFLKISGTTVQNYIEGTHQATGEALCGIIEFIRFKEDGLSISGHWLLTGEGDMHLNEIENQKRLLWKCLMEGKWELDLKEKKKETKE